jgi:hypothetical protein
MARLSGWETTMGEMVYVTGDKNLQRLPDKVKVFMHVQFEFVLDASEYGGDMKEFVRTQETEMGKDDWARTLKSADCSIVDRTVLTIEAAE